jgi:hypothetical protein
VVEVLDRVPDHRVVDHRQQFREVVKEHLEVQHFVAAVQLLQVHVLGQLAVLRLELLVGALGLLVEGENGRRKPAGQAQGLALRFGECHPTVTERVGKDLSRARLASR